MRGGIGGLRDDNGYPLPETRWVFALLGYVFGSISLHMGLLMVQMETQWVRGHEFVLPLPIPANTWVFKTHLKIIIPYKYVSYIIN
jgi:hypothetical protein